MSNDPFDPRSGEMSRDDNIWRRNAALRRVHTGEHPVTLDGPTGYLATGVLWALDSEKGELSVKFDNAFDEGLLGVPPPPVLACVNVETTRLQFWLANMQRVKSTTGQILRFDLPTEIVYLKRRKSVRVQEHDAQLGTVSMCLGPQGGFKSMKFELLSAGIGGCSFQAPRNVAGLEVGARNVNVIVELRDEPMIVAQVEVRHVSPDVVDPYMCEIGTQWQSLNDASRAILERTTRRGQLRQSMLTLF